MKKNIEDKIISPNQRKRIEKSFSKFKTSVPNKNKNIKLDKYFSKKKKIIEEKKSVKEKLRKQLIILRKIWEKKKKKVYKRMLSNKKNLYNQIKSKEKKILLNGKNILNQIKSKAKKNSLAEKNIIDQIKSREKSNRLAEKEIIEEINSEKKSNCLAEKEIIEEIKKILDQINNKKRKEISNEKKIFNKKKRDTRDTKDTKKKGLQDIKNVSDERKERVKKSIEEKKKIYNEKRGLAKEVIEEREKIYDEKKKRVKRSLEEKKKIYNEEKKRGKRVIEKNKKIYNEKNIIAKKIIKDKKHLLYKEKRKALQNISKIKVFWRMWQARLQLGDRRSVWNPKMAPYIYTTTKSPYQIINLVKTYKCLKKISHLLYQAASKNQTVLFVGTYNSDLIINAAGTSKSFCVNQRWLGGILTNWKTIKKSKRRFRIIKLRERLKTIPLHLKLKKVYRNILKKHSLEKPNFLKDKEKLVLLFNLLKDQKEFNLLEEKEKSNLLESKKELEVITTQFQSQALQLLEIPYLQNLPKKQAATKQREKERLKKYFNGLTCLIKVPDIVIIVGQRRESNAVRECQKLGIKSITILDTDCDPTLADLFVPANDDSRSSLQLLLTFFSKAIQKGREEFKKKPKKKKKKLPWYARKRKKKKVVSFRLRKNYKKYRHRVPAIPEFLGFVP